MKMNIGNDWHPARSHNLFQRGGGFHIGTGNADDINPGLFTPPDLVNRRLCVGRERVGHRLHRHRRVAPDGDVAHHDLAAFAAGDVPPRSD